MIRALWMVAAIHAASAAPTRQPGDDALMFAAAMADLLPPGQRLSGEEAASRPLFVGVAASEQAFGKARGRPVALDLAPVLDRPFAARTFEEVEVCAPPRGRGPECTIRDHGLWVDVRRVALSATGDSATMWVAVVWAGPKIRERDSMQGFTAELYLARTERGWRVVRRGRYAVS
jgi:hypothetical protein